MAITQDELQSIVTAVLSSIRTNSQTIEQLTPVTSLNDMDSIEIGGGKRITYGTLKQIIATIFSENFRTIGENIEGLDDNIAVVEKAIADMRAHPSVVYFAEAPNDLSKHTTVAGEPPSDAEHRIIYATLRRAFLVEVPATKTLYKQSVLLAPYNGEPNTHPNREGDYYPRAEAVFVSDDGRGHTWHAASKQLTAFDATIQPIGHDALSAALVANDFPALSADSGVIVAPPAIELADDIPVGDDAMDGDGSLSDDDVAPFEQAVGGVMYRDSNPSQW